MKKSLTSLALTAMLAFTQTGAQASIFSRVLNNTVKTVVKAGHDTEVQARRSAGDVAKATHKAVKDTGTEIKRHPEIGVAAAVAATVAIGAATGIPVYLNGVQVL